jgi:hypothetical protein
MKKIIIGIVLCSSASAFAELGAYQTRFTESYDLKKQVTLKYDKYTKKTWTEPLKQPATSFKQAIETCQNLMGTEWTIPSSTDILDIQRDIRGYNYGDVTYEVLEKENPAINFFWLQSNYAYGYFDRYFFTSNQLNGPLAVICIKP